MQSLEPYAQGYAVGSVLGGRYQIDMILSRRSASVRCLCRDMVPPHATVVVQSLPDRQLAHRGELLRELFRGAQIVDVLKRDDLVQILDFNVEQATGTLFLVMAHRAGATANELSALTGPENKTAAAFVELARGLLESHDAQFLDSPQVTSPSLPPSRNPGPTSSARRKRLTPAPTPMHLPAEPRTPTQPASRASAPPRERTPTRPIVSSHLDTPAANHPSQWREADESSNRIRVKGRLSRRNELKLTRTHIAVIAGVTLLLGVAVLFGTASHRPGYGPRAITRSGWNDYSNPYANQDDRPGLMNAQNPGERAQITVTSNPPGALVYSGTQPMGATPVQLKRPGKNKRVLLRFSKPGYIEQTAVVTPTSPSLVTVLLSASMSASPAAKKPNKKGGLDRMPGFNTNISGDAKSAAPNPYDTSIRAPSESPNRFRPSDRFDRTNDPLDRTDRLDRFN